MQITPEGLMHIMYPHGITKEQLEPAMDAYKALLTLEAQEPARKRTVNAYPSRGVTRKTLAATNGHANGNGTARAHATQANREAKAIAAAQPRIVKVDKDLFLDLLKTGGTMFEIAKKLGISKTYGYGLMNDAIKATGGKLIKSQHADGGRTTFYKLVVG